MLRYGILSGQPGSIRDLTGANPDLTGSIPDIPDSIPDLIGAIPDLPGGILDLKLVKNGTSGMLPGRPVSIRGLKS